MEILASAPLLCWLPPTPCLPEVSPPVTGPSADGCGPAHTASVSARGSHPVPLSSAAGSPGCACGPCMKGGTVRFSTQKPNWQTYLKDRRTTAARTRRSANADSWYLSPMIYVNSNLYCIRPLFRVKLCVIAATRCDTHMSCTARPCLIVKALVLSWSRTMGSTGFP